MNDIETLNDSCYPEEQSSTETVSERINKLNEHNRFEEANQVESIDSTDNLDFEYEPVDDTANVSFEDSIPPFYANESFWSHIKFVEENYVDYSLLPDMPTVAATDFIRITDIQPEQIEWLWSPFIPLGKTTFIMGDTGVGKTTLMLAIIANISRGNKFPLGNVIYLASEDSFSETIKPKLINMGADCDRVITIDKSKEPLTSVDDPRLPKAIEAYKPVAVIFDPIKSYLGKANMNSNTQIRAMMDKLNKMAERYNCAIILLGHTGRQGSGNTGAYRIQGSIEFITASRSVLRLGPNPNEIDERAITIVKANHAQINQSYGYAIDENCQFIWTGESGLTAEDMDKKPQKDKQGRTPRDRCKERIKQLLANGPMDTEALTKALKEEAFSDSTIKRAKKDLGVESYNSGFGSKWYSILPSLDDAK